MFDQKVPKLWSKISWMSESLSIWFSEFIARNEQYGRWIYEARPNVFWMTGFFNAQGHPISAVLTMAGSLGFELL